MVEFAGVWGQGRSLSFWLRAGFEYLGQEKALDQGREEHKGAAGEGCDPDIAAPGAPAKSVGRDIEGARREIGKGQRGGIGAALAGRMDDQRSGGKERQHDSGIVIGAQHAGCDLAHLAAWEAITRRGCIAHADIDIGHIAGNGELRDMQQANEGKGCEFEGHRGFSIPSIRKATPLPNRAKQAIPRTAFVKTIHLLKKSLNRDSGIDAVKA